MSLKLITELVEDVELILEESNGRKDYFIHGPFLQTEIKNRNGRVYPRSIMEREVARYTKDLIKEGRALGELGHPDGPAINLPLVSHKIISLEQNGNDFHGKAKILDTPNGKIVKSLLDEGVKLGVSSRGLGSIHSTAHGNMVGEDFMLATAADIVSDPSAPNAFVRGIMEGKEWVWNNGVLKEAQVAEIYREIVKAPVKKTATRKLIEAAAFEKFLHAIKVSVLTEVHPMMQPGYFESDQTDYSWIITKDSLGDEPGSVGTIGPSWAKERKLSDFKKSECARFRLKDDDGEIYYYGLFRGDSKGEDGFGPLSDFGEPNAGCTSIEYDRNGTWEAL